MDVVEVGSDERSRVPWYAAAVVAIVLLAIGGAVRAGHVEHRAHPAPTPTISVPPLETVPVFVLGNMTAPTAAPSVPTTTWFPSFLLVTDQRIEQIDTVDDRRFPVYDGEGSVFNMQRLGPGFVGFETDDVALTHSLVAVRTGHPLREHVADDDGMAQDVDTSHFWLVHDSGRVAVRRDVTGRSEPAVTMPDGWGFVRGTVAGLLVAGQDGIGLGVWRPGDRRPRVLARGTGYPTASSSRFVVYADANCPGESCAFDVIDVRTGAMTHYDVGPHVAIDVDDEGHVLAASGDGGQLVVMLRPGRPSVTVAATARSGVAVLARWAAPGRAVVAMQYDEAVDVLTWDVATGRRARAGVYETSGATMSELLPWVP